VRISSINAGYTMFQGSVDSTGSRGVRSSGSNAAYTMFWGSVDSTGSRGVHISSSNAGYTMFRGSAKGTGYPLNSPVSPSPPLPCVTMCCHISTGVYQSRHLNILPMQIWMYSHLKEAHLYSPDFQL